MATSQARQKGPARCHDRLAALPGVARLRLWPVPVLRLATRATMSGCGRHGRGVSAQAVEPEGVRCVHHTGSLLLLLLLLLVALASHWSCAGDHLHETTCEWTG